MSYSPDCREVIVTFNGDTNTVRLDSIDGELVTRDAPRGFCIELRKNGDRVGFVVPVATPNGFSLDFHPEPGFESTAIHFGGAPHTTNVEHLKKLDGGAAGDAGGFFCIATEPTGAGR